MPKDIPLRRMPPILDGILIKRGQLLKQRRAVDVIHEARRQAAGLVKQARSEAGDIRRQAFGEGYQEGMVAAAAAVAAYLEDQQRLSSALQKQVDERARRLLSNALNHPELLLTLLDEWLAMLPAKAPVEPLQLMMPESARGSHRRLKQKLQVAWPGKCSIKYHDEARLVLKYGHQLAEFNSPEFMASAMRRLTTLEELSAECHQLTERGLRQIHEIFIRRYACDNAADNADNEDAKYDNANIV